MNEIMVSVTPGLIKSNLDDLAAALHNQMEAYKDLEVTEDNIPERKADLATLRKESKAIDDKRKEIKAQWDAPLKEFEAKVKDVTKIIDEQITRIDVDIKAYDRKRVEEKQAHIKTLYEDVVGEYAEYLPLSVIKSSKWDNKTCGDNDIIAEMQEMVMRVRNDLDAIHALGSEHEDRLITCYKANGNSLQAAIKKDADLREAQKIAEERLAAEQKAKEEAERRAEEAKREEEQRKIASENAWDDTEQIPVVNTQTGETVGFVDPDLEPVYTIRIKGEQNMKELRSFLTFNNIKFEEV